MKWRPSYLHNRHSTNLLWQTRATTFTGADTTKTGDLIHWDFGDGTSQDALDPIKVYPDTSLKTLRMISTDGWGGLTKLWMDSESLRGSIPSLDLLTALTDLEIFSNGLTGGIPSLAANVALVTFDVGNNLSLGGTLPSLTTNTALEYFDTEYCQIGGTVPNLDANTALVTFNVQVNYLEGAIPSLAANTALEVVAFDYNGFDTYTGGLGTRDIVIYNVYNNSLPAEAINAILADLVVAQAGGNPVCDAVLSHNNAPTGQGLLDKATLIAAGWTVTTD